ncbi:MAG: hypothetical protein AAF460_00695 [Pseudomonadota bacterium]
MSVTSAQKNVASRVANQTGQTGSAASTGGGALAPRTGALTVNSGSGGQTTTLPPAADCTPDFQGVGHEHSLWPQTDFGLPTVVGQSKTWSHPGAGTHSVKVTKMADGSSASSMGATSYLNRIPEYSQHDAFSADGTYLISHGITTRGLMNAKTYQNVRAVNNGSITMGDWQWHPTVDRYAFYFDQHTDRVYRYDADADTHTLLFDFQSTPVTVGAQSFSNLGTSNNTYSMGGQGSITADGNKVAVIMNGSGNGALVQLNLDTQTVGGGVFFSGLDTSSELDSASISPDGQYLIAMGDFDSIYGTSFSRNQIYAYDVSNLNVNNRILVYGRESHFDVGLDANGDPVVVIFGHAPVNGWNGRTTDSGVGLVAGVGSYNIATQTYTQVLQRELWGGSGMPSGHISMPLDGAGVALISSYQGGHPDSSSFAQNNAMIAVDLANGNVAWLGWDEGANDGIETAGTVHGYYAQPHSSLVHDAEFGDGSRGWKVAFASDNRSTGAWADLYIAEIRCN